MAATDKHGDGEAGWAQGEEGRPEGEASKGEGARPAKHLLACTSGPLCFVHLSPAGVDAMGQGFVLPSHGPP
jgi:hypothetical protein